MNHLNDLINELKILSQVNNVPLPDNKLLDDYEKEIGFKFSEDYRKVLKNLSNIFYGTIDLLSVTKEKKYPSELATVLKEARQQGVPLDWLPICEDNGNYYCLLKDGSVKYWSHDGSVNESWSDLATWIKNVWIDDN
ncbi:SMI1/KNR4 family protein [Neisseriaceae bacterium ESL0693]|nr:SMI1/KNR4 family protein [Neisseriaceae bacterium ESL0693]